MIFAVKEKSKRFERCGSAGRLKNTAVAFSSHLIAMFASHGQDGHLSTPPPGAPPHMPGSSSSPSPVIDPSGRSSPSPLTRSLQVYFSFGAPAIMGRAAPMNCFPDMPMIAGQEPSLAGLAPRTGHRALREERWRVTRTRWSRSWPSDPTVA